MSKRASRTSESHPIRVDFIESDTLSLSGRIGMTIAPGMKASSAAGRWDRDLQSDLDRLRRHYGTEVLVSLMEPEELEAYGIPDLIEVAREAGIEVLHFPITDVRTPRKSESKEYAKLVSRIVELLGEGKAVVVHCRGGLGRTGTVAASVLVALGYPARDAIGEVRKARSERAVETRDQERYVERFEKEWRDRYSPQAVLNRYQGCLLGLAVGDALGTTLEFKPPASFEPIEDMVGGGPFGLAPGEWTDDTSMALCLAESLIEKRGFDPADQMQKYLRWYKEGHMSPTGECFDIGNATRAALERFERTGGPYSGSTDPKSAGNGSIMRLAPVALFYVRIDYQSPAPYPEVSVIERSGGSSRTTHGARTAVDACRYLGALIAGAVNGASKEEILSERYSPVGCEYWDHHPLVEEVERVASGSFKRREPPEIRGRTYVVGSLEAAMWAFYKSNSFREGALLAVNLGDDADTTGAVYGQLAGAYYGESGIPKPWRLRLAHCLLIEHFAERLFTLASTIDWERVLEYLPGFERRSSEYAGAFVETLYAAGVIDDFDTLQWREEAERLMSDTAALAAADEDTLRKLLTYHVRWDHFDNEHLQEAIESGHIASILQSVQNLYATHRG